MASIPGNARVERVEEIPWKEVEGEGIILDLKTGDYFELDEIGLWIWKQLDGKKSVSAIAEKMSEEYQVDKRNALADLTDFIGALQKAALVQMAAGKSQGK